FGSSRRRSDMGMDLETQVDITLEQVASGVEKTIEFERMDYCETCGGTGAKPGTSPVKCKTCGGYGQVQQQAAGFFGMSVRVITCPDCHGRGTIVTNPCKNCSGTGRVRKQRTLTVNIPAGIHDGQVLRVRGEGEPSLSGTAKGDLHVYVHVNEHPFFIRRNDDIICSVPVSFVQAALGGTITIPTLAGPEDIEISAGVQHGHIITLKRRGLPNINGRTAGHEHVQIMVEIPKKLTARQRELLVEYAATEDADVTTTRKNFINRLKDHFKDWAESLSNNMQVQK
ncbi:MAG TPA: DnaJ C-terminal domain-containing protein, partial [Phycisphaerae bacterium]|nr:DnaJ C-terminal domain-containing protein [Phycisphaerae bacterium]